MNGNTTTIKLRSCDTLTFLEVDGDRLKVRLDRQATLLEPAVRGLEGWVSRTELEAAGYEIRST